MPPEMLPDMNDSNVPSPITEERRQPATNKKGPQRGPYVNSLCKLRSPQAPE